MSQYISFEAPVPPPAEGGFGQRCVAFDQKWIPYIVGALQALLDETTYESEAGRAVKEAADLILLLQTGVCVVGLKVGMVINYATAAVPSNCLSCDGASYLRADYPALYAALHASFKTDADHFVVPDFRGRAAIGIGTGAGLTARAMKASIGAETHALSIPEMPAHTHDISTNNSGSGAPNGVSGTQNASNTQTASAKALTRGSGAAHNNMPPSLAVGFCIVALD